jgi:hypothetical protein
MKPLAVDIGAGIHVCLLQNKLASFLPQSRVN